MITKILLVLLSPAVLCVPQNLFRSSDSLPLEHRSAGGGGLLLDESQFNQNIYYEDLPASLAPPLFRSAPSSLAPPLHRHQAFIPPLAEQRPLPPGLLEQAKQNQNLQQLIRSNNKVRLIYIPISELDPELRDILEASESNIESLQAIESSNVDIYHYPVGAAADELQTLGAGPRLVRSHTASPGTKNNIDINFLHSFLPKGSQIVRVRAYQGILPPSLNAQSLKNATVRILQTRPNLDQILDDSKHSPLSKDAGEEKEVTAAILFDDRRSSVTPTFTTQLPTSQLTPEPTFNTTPRPIFSSTHRQSTRSPIFSSTHRPTTRTPSRAPLFSSISSHTPEFVSTTFRPSFQSTLVSTPLFHTTQRPAIVTTDDDRFVRAQNPSDHTSEADEATELVLIVDMDNIEPGKTAALMVDSRPTDEASLDEKPLPQVFIAPPDYPVPRGYSRLPITYPTENLLPEVLPEINPNNRLPPAYLANVNHAAPNGFISIPIPPSFVRDANLEHLVVTTPAAPTTEAADLIIEELKEFIKTPERIPDNREALQQRPQLPFRQRPQFLPHPAANQFNRFPGAGPIRGFNQPIPPFLQNIRPNLNAGPHFVPPHLQFRPAPPAPAFAPQNIGHPQFGFAPDFIAPEGPRNYLASLQNGDQLVPNALDDEGQSPRTYFATDQETPLIFDEKPLVFSNQNAPTLEPFAFSSPNYIDNFADGGNSGDDERFARAQNPSDHASVNQLVTEQKTPSPTAVPTTTHRTTPSFPYAFVGPANVPPPEGYVEVTTEEPKPEPSEKVEPTTETATTVAATTSPTPTTTKTPSITTYKPKLKSFNIKKKVKVSKTPIDSAPAKTEAFKIRRRPITPTNRPVVSSTPSRRKSIFSRPRERFPIRRFKSSTTPRTRRTTSTTTQAPNIDYELDYDINDNKKKPTAPKLEDAPSTLFPPFHVAVRKYRERYNTKESTNQGPIDTSGFAGFGSRIVPKEKKSQHKKVPARNDLVLSGSENIEAILESEREQNYQGLEGPIVYGVASGSALPFSQHGLPKAPEEKPMFVIMAETMDKKEKVADRPAIKEHPENIEYIYDENSPYYDYPAEGDEYYYDYPLSDKDYHYDDSAYYDEDTTISEEPLYTTTIAAPTTVKKNQTITTEPSTTTSTEANIQTTVDKSHSEAVTETIVVPKVETTAAASASTQTFSITSAPVTEQPEINNEVHANRLSRLHPRPVSEILGTSTATEISQKSKVCIRGKCYEVD